MVIPLLLLLSSSSYCCNILSEGPRLHVIVPTTTHQRMRNVQDIFTRRKRGMKYIHVLYIYIVYSIEFVESTRLIGKNTFKYTLSRAFVTCMSSIFLKTLLFIGWDVASGTSMRRLVREMKNNFTFQDDEKDDDEEINYYYTT